MKKISILNRIILLITVLLAAFQIINGDEGLAPLALWGYTVGFGTLLVASLLLIILGFEGLENQVVVIVSTLIPLSISLGLIGEHLTSFMVPYLVFCLAGFITVAITRYFSAEKTATLVLAVTHGVAGLVITFLPFILSLQGFVPPGYTLVGIGGALMGLGGLLLAFLKAGRPILSERLILTVLPILLLLMTSAFVYGFSFS